MIGFRVSCLGFVVRLYLHACFRVFIATTVCAFVRLLRTSARLVCESLCVRMSCRHAKKRQCMNQRCVKLSASV